MLQNVGLVIVLGLGLGNSGLELELGLGLGLWLRNLGLGLGSRVEAMARITSDSFHQFGLACVDDDFH